MKPKSSVLLLVCCFYFATTSIAQSNIFLKLDGIDGPVTQKGFEKWIQVTGVEQATTNAVTMGGSGGSASVGKVKFSEFRVKKAIDKTSPLLLLNTSSGKHIPKATIVFTGFDGIATYTITLTDVILTGVTTISECNPPCKTSEMVTIAFGKAEWVFKDKAGVITKGGWDAVRNTAIN